MGIDRDLRTEKLDWGDKTAGGVKAAYLQRFPDPPCCGRINVAREIAKERFISLSALRQQLEHLLVTNAFHILIDATVIMIGALTTGRSHAIAFNFTLPAGLACLC